MRTFITLLALSPIGIFACDRCAYIENDINEQIYVVSNRLHDFNDAGLRPNDIVMLTERLHVLVELRCKHFGY